MNKPSAGQGSAQLVEGLPRRLRGRRFHLALVWFAWPRWEPQRSGTG